MKLAQERHATIKERKDTAATDEDNIAIGFESILTSKYCNFSAVLLQLKFLNEGGIWHISALKPNGVVNLVVEDNICACCPVTKFLIFVKGKIANNSLICSDFIYLFFVFEQN